MKASFTARFGLSALARPAGQQLVEQGIGQHAQQFGDDAHLPGDDAVADTSGNGLESAARQSPRVASGTACCSGLDRVSGVSM
jgi:hypothetical protein